MDAIWKQDIKAETRNLFVFIKILIHNSFKFHDLFTLSALHYAAMTTGDPIAIKLLIKFGAFVNITNDEMMSPLFNAVISNNPQAASFLIECNADYKIRNKDGQTAFDLIREIEEWIKSDCFDIKMKGILKSKFIKLCF